MAVEIALHLGDAGVVVVKDGCGQRGVRVAAREDIGEVLEATGAPGRDHGNVHRVRDGRRHLAVEARPGAVPVHRRQQNLTGAAGLGFAPVPRVAFSERASLRGVRRLDLTGIGPVAYHLATREGVPLPAPAEKLRAALGKG